jgi:hypothetical protein
MTNQQVWESDHGYLRKVMAAEITKRKIQKIAFDHDGKLLVAEVGKRSPYNVASSEPFTKMRRAAAI